MSKAAWRSVYALLLAILLVLAPAFPAAASDAQVWVNTGSGVYHCPGGQYYGATKRGKYMSESGAIASGYRAAYGNPCSGEVARGARQRAIESLAPARTGAPVKVWINIGSHVYHCPDSRYYGATKRGRFASESEAIGTGNRPAYGQRCG
ncbi:hypothetical protein [Thermomonas brevis]